MSLIKQEGAYPSDHISQRTQKREEEEEEEGRYLPKWNQIRCNFEGGENAHLLM